MSKRRTIIYGALPTTPSSSTVYGLLPPAPVSDPPPSRYGRSRVSVSGPTEDTLRQALRGTDWNWVRHVFSPPGLSKAIQDLLDRGGSHHEWKVIFLQMQKFAKGNAELMRVLQNWSALFQRRRFSDGTRRGLLIIRFNSQDCTFFEEVLRDDRRVGEPLPLF